MKKIGLLILSLALVATLSACAANATPTPSPMITMMATPTPNGTGMMPGASPTATDDAAMTAAMTGAESNALSQKANDATAKISEIDACVTAIIGDTCMAGVTFDAQYQGELTDRIRDMVTARIQSVAPNVERVAVTDDPQVAAEIGSFAEKIRQTSALGDLTYEFDTILSDIE